MGINDMDVKLGEAVHLEVRIVLKCFDLDPRPFDHRGHYASFKGD